MIRRPSPQLNLLDLAPVRQQRGGVSTAMHAEIVALRLAGFRVYAEGHHHRVDGRLLDTRQLRRLIAARMDQQ